LCHVADGDARLNFYDAVRYNNLPNKQTHPSRLFVLGKLAGFDPPPAETCRVLELGTSEGINIIGMAVGLPRAQFTGIDLAQEPVARARRTAADLGLANVRFECMNLLNIDRFFGEFDYILAHGIYGWTPPEVGAKILDVARQCLSPKGMIFVSYNAQPAGHIRKLVRDMMLFHIGAVEEPAERLEKARAFLRVLAEGRPAPEAFDLAAAAYAAVLLKHSDSALFHDELAPIYEPVYFRDFAAHAAAHGLQYAGDASGFDTPPNLKPETKEAARTMSAGDRIAEEQYLDFFRMRGFRQSLLCRKEVSLAAEWEPERILGAYAVTLANQAEDGAFLSGDSDNIRMTTTHPVPVEYLRKLIAAQPLSLPVTAEDASVALALFKVGIIELHGVPGVARRAGDYPCASPLARHQAAHGEPVVATLRHRALELGDAEARRVLTLLDGTRDHNTLCQEMGCTPEVMDAELLSLGKQGLLIA
jgi:SAM-dependent methyltransferase